MIGGQPAFGCSLRSGSRGGEKILRMPITGVSFCCARAMSAKIAAAATRRPPVRAALFDHSMGDRGRPDLPFSPRPAWTVFTEQDSARGVVPPNVWAAIDYGGSGGWAITPSRMRGVLNDAVSLYFADARLASAFVAR